MNPVAAKRNAVSLWLSNGAITRPDEAALSARIQSLVAAGFRSYDASRLASAEISESAVFVTVLLRLLKQAGRLPGSLTTRVTEPLRLVEEVDQWNC